MTKEPPEYDSVNYKTFNNSVEYKSTGIKASLHLTELSYEKSSEKVILMLRNCSTCKSKPQINKFKDYGHEFIQIVCSICNLHTIPYKDLKDAMRVWNEGVKTI